MGKGTSHRLFDAPKACGYGIVTLAGGGVTLTLSAATVAIGMTLIGLPLALLVAELTVCAAAGTTYTGSKTIHKTRRVFGSEDDCHSRSQASRVLAYASIIDEQLSDIETSDHPCPR